MTDPDNIEREAIERLWELEVTGDYDAATVGVGNAWVDGYLEGWHAAIRERGGQS